MRDWKVDLPEGVKGDVEIRKLVIPENDLSNMMMMLQGGRQTQPGTYTALYRDNGLWMSDTDAEASDHSHAYWQMERRGGRWLIAGLGLGMIVRKGLQLENVEHIDVVEIDPDVAALVGPAYEGPRCTIHVGDIFDLKWPKGTRWTGAWFDVWKDLCVDDLAEHAKLARSYGRRVDWQGSWGKELLLAHRRREQRWY